jgi:hypothetical protein
LGYPIHHKKSLKCLLKSRTLAAKKREKVSKKGVEFEKEANYIKWRKD